MVKLRLSISAELENVTGLVPVGDDFEYFFKVKCTNCHQEHSNFVSLNRTEERELSHGKGNTANFVWRCGECKRESSAKFEPTSPQPYSAENALWGPLLVIECRGLEFIGFDPRGIWRCTGASSGTVFGDVDLEQGEWSDYDDKAKLPVGVGKVQGKWDRA